MQPTPPNAPRPPSAPMPPPRSSIGPGLIVGILAVVAIMYLVDHGTKGEAAIFGGIDRRITDQDFHGAQCTAVFGGCKIDLRDAQMQGSEAVMETYAVFGGVEIRVPEDWEVVSRGTAVFGGFENHARRHSSGPATKTLIVDGAAVFGGVSVKD